MRVYALTPSTSLDGTFDAKLVRSLKPHSGPVVTSAIDSTGTLLATGGADGVVKVWDIRGGYTTHTLHGHSGVVSALHFFQVPPDTESRSKSRKRKSRDGEEMQVDGLSEGSAGYRLASGGEDGKIRIWDLQKRKSLRVLDSHVSVVRSLEYSSEAQLLLSASRDKTVIAWDAKTWQPRTTMPVLEGIERAGFVAAGRFFFTGGENGRLRIWNASGQEKTKEQEPGIETDAIIDVLHPHGSDFVLSVHADQTLLLHSLKPLLQDQVASSIGPLPIVRRISGTHDEVIDMAFVGLEGSLMALATNSEDIRLIDVRTGTRKGTDDTSYFGADVATLRGHEDIIITLDSDWSGHWLATGAKDNIAKLWRLDPDNMSFGCYATFSGHAESISAVCLPHDSPPVGSQAFRNPLGHPPRYLMTGSQDRTVKKWEIPSEQGGKKAIRAAYTRKAHDKDINALDTSTLPGPPMFASASQDRTVKIWDLESGESIGVLRGHKRGVWSVAFSSPSTPAISGESGSSSGKRGMAVTGSADKTVRIWSLNDFSCLRTFEGHANSVLKVVWLPAPKNREKKRNVRGNQVASAAGDGLVKVWDAQTNECAATLDNHIDRVWALAVRPSRSAEVSQESEVGQDDDEKDDGEDSTETPLELVSGSADSTLTFWTDTTTLTSERSAIRATARVEQDQELQNHMHAQNYREAIVLALQLNHPKRLLDLFTRVLDSPQPDEGSLMGRRGVDEVLAGLGDEQLWRLMLRLRDWNANARTARVAQRVMYALFRLFPKDKFVQLQRRRQHQQHQQKKMGADESDGLVEGVQGLKVDEEAGSKTGQRQESIRDVVEGLKAYTERHSARMDKMAEERWVLLWTLQQMEL